MKKILGTVSIALACLNFNATALADSQVANQINACTNFTQFFKFTNHYQDPQYGFIIIENKFNATTTLHSWETFKPGTSDTFSTTYKANKSVVDGEAYFVGASKKPKTLCGISFSCACPKSICKWELTVAGTRCNIHGGFGTQDSPFVINLD